MANDREIEGNADRILQLDLNVSSISRALQVFENTQQEYENRVSDIKSNIIATDTRLQDNVDSISQLDSNVSSNSDTIKALGDTQQELNSSLTEIESDIIATDAKVRENTIKISQLGSNVTTISDTMHVFENTKQEYENRVSDIDWNIIAADTRVQGNADSISQLGLNIFSINGTVQDLITKHREYEIMVNTSVAEIGSDKMNINRKLQGNVDRVSELERNVSSISVNLKVLENTLPEYENRFNTSVEEIESDIMVTDTKVQGNADRISQLKTNVSSISGSIHDIENLIKQYETRLTALEGLHSYGFHVLRTKTVTYKGYQFLVLEVKVPESGLSRNDNWCLDYQLLCESYNKRPTGCGQLYASNQNVPICRDKYNSDMNINNTLGCNPSRKIAEVANMAFPDLTTAVTYKNAFGFLYCTPEHCQKTIRGSELALTYMAAFWESNETTFYTVCR